ncbi:NAD(P)-dependent oxidoreductase [Paraburkholderia sp. ZP32-5]|uniref:NAD(P)-dependent oxidoreductase n=1 Tax=Paraburkholderia sp. ZP32-5 TaxID=2883245 RepID=UPI001F275653|nr:NAD(P)-dependent oxidoreductase [Paraburkholderia sp. ZP32-5]
MTQPTFRIAYLDRPMYPSFDETLARAPGVELIRIAPTQADEDILATLATCHGYYVMASRDELPKQWHVTSSLLATLPSLVLAVSYGAGYDTIDVDACTHAGVAVVNQAGGNAQGVAEHAIGMMMVLFKRIPEAQYAIIAGTAAQRDALMGRELSGKTVGVIGLGNTGSRTAALARALGCPVLTYDPYLDASTCEARGARKVELDALLADADAVSVHCPLTAETRGLLGAAQFAAMKRGAIFVNTARGSTYDEAALHAALVRGQLGGAGIDVWEQEPPARDHPLLAHPAVIASSHMGGVTHESRDRVARMAAEAFIDAAAGRVPQRLVNPGVTAQFLVRLGATLGEPAAAS